MTQSLRPQSRPLRSLRKPLLALLLSLSLQLSAFAGLAGNWQGNIQLPGQALEVSISLKQDPQGSWTGSIDIPAQKAKGLPLKEIQVKGQDVSFQIEGIPGNPTFKGTLSDTSLKGSFTQGGQNFPFSLNQAAASASATTDTDSKPDPEKLRTMIREQSNQALTAWKTPGIAVAVYHKGELLLAEGFGYRDLENKQPVTPETVFAIGSSSKAFTSAAIGMLVDEGKLQWDTPVVQMLPGFALQDPIATAQASVRDLLSHRTGLPRHDLSWYGSPRSRAELFAMLKYLPPTAPFRTRFQYQNLMYMSAGLLLEQLSGQSWEDFVSTRIFTPLEMNRSSTSLSGLQGDANHSEPYRLDGDKAVKIPFRNLDAIGPAGSINSSISDMAKWLQFNLGNGLVPGQTKGQAGETRLLEAATLGELHSPQMIAGKTGTADVPYTLYGLGWFVQPYRGETLIQHGGNIDGFTAMVALMPKHDTGLVILSNKNGDALNTALMFNLLDRLIGLETRDWNSRLKGMLPSESAQPANAPKPHFPQVKDTRPSHELRAYQGTYSHPGYGELRISSQGNGLKVDFRDFGGPLKHWHYDSFRVEQPGSVLDGQLLSFFTDNLGRIERLELSLEAETGPVSFTRQLDPTLSQPERLQRYTGIYQLSGTPITFSFKNNKLQMTVPGQPVYDLEPMDDNLFQIKGLKGFYISFILDQNKVKAVELLQPNGAYRAEKQ